MSSWEEAEAPAPAFHLVQHQLVLNPKGLKFHI